MANRNKENVKRFVEGVSADVAKAAYEGGDTPISDYEIKFVFTNQYNLDITVFGLLPVEVTDFVIQFLNARLEELGLPDRVESVQDVVDLADKYKDTIGAVIVCSLCNLMIGKAVMDNAEYPTCMGYATLYGEENYDTNTWDIFIGKLGLSAVHTIATFSGTAYNITSSTLKSIELL